MLDTTREAYKALGFNETLPVEQGRYAVICGESDFYPYLVEIKEIDGELNVADSDIGTNPLVTYDYNLDSVMYKRIGALL